MYYEKIPSTRELSRFGNAGLSIQFIEYLLFLVRMKFKSDKLVRYPLEKHFPLVSRQPSRSPIVIAHKQLNLERVRRYFLTYENIGLGVEEIWRILKKDNSSNRAISSFTRVLVLVHGILGLLIITIFILFW